MKQQVQTTQRVVNNYLGRKYTFFLSNYSLPNDSFFYYQIYSPGLNKDLNPVWSLEKLGERTKPGQSFDQGRDLLTAALGGKEDIDRKGTEWIKNVLRNPDLNVVNDGTKFPVLELGTDKSAQKSLICGIRDSIRWKYYRFFPGRKVDILWTPTEFVVFDICGDDKNVWFKPVAVYKNTDYLMENPLPVSLDTINCENLKWEKGKSSEINQTIRKIEWNSFDSRFRFQR